MYDLHRLGWSSFQQLCLTITREVLGQTVESFLDSKDGGRDGAFAGTWKCSGSEELTGRFVIQCKFSGNPSHRLRLSDLKDEVQKLGRLVDAGLCDNYVLMTNTGLSGESARRIRAKALAAGAKHVLCYGSTWINQQIRENKRLRMLVPRLYGLGDLSQILDERAYTQARAILESMREDLGKVVVTNAYSRAASALDQHGFVLLIGEPAAGKTTIASLLAMAAVDQWDVSLLKLNAPNELIRWNPEEPSQFFWLDDAFGVSQYEWSLASAWNHLLPQIKTMLTRGAKIVMTSRDYIYNRARKDLKESAFPLLKESQVVIDVHALTDTERRQILYNHLKLGRQPVKFRRAVKPNLESVAAHDRFIPEIARRLSDPIFTQGISLTEYGLKLFVEKREQLLREVIQGLDSDNKAALALIYMRNDRLASPIELEPSEREAIERLGSTVGGCVVALDALNNSLVQHVHIDGESIWRFKHPTIGDAYAATLVESPELLGIFVRGSAADKLVEQVTCGDVGIQKAVILPRSLFPLMLEKLRNLTSNYKSDHLNEWSKTRQLQYFLAYRCSKDFLEEYLKTDLGILDRVSKPGLFLNSVSEVRLAFTFQDLGLLPEEHRKQFVKAVSDYAIRGDDLEALDNAEIQSLFRDDELEALLHEVRNSLFPTLSTLRERWERNYDPDEDTADDYMQRLLKRLDILSDHFGDDEQAVTILSREKKRAREWVESYTPPAASAKPERILGDVESDPAPISARSIFDDVDV
jgi:hypothetical protein